MNATSADHALAPARSRTAIVYGLMIAAAAAAFWLIHHLGSSLQAPPPAQIRAPGAAPSSSNEVLLHVLLAMLVIVLAARALGTLFRYLSQPAVVGEVIAGIALGPSLLGALAPDLTAFILPTQIAPHLNVLAQVGVMLFMFLVGLELDTSLLREKPHAALAISHASILAPFVLGATTALWIYPLLSSSDVPFGLFAMFMGVAMSITAFPVLARILLDRGLSKTRLGVIAISCAAVDDVTAWCLLAVIASMAEARAQGALVTIVLTVVYLVFMLALARPLIARLVRRVDAQGAPSQGAIGVVFVALLLSALATEAIGIHAIFGAFVLGAVMPHDARFAGALARKLEDLVVVLLLPAYFAFTGMRTQIGLVSGASQWLICGAIVLIACAGKFGGTFLAARTAGLSTRDSASLGALMNTRGLMELVVLNLGFDLGVISPTLFAMMVLMAVLTTMATSPLLTLFGTRSVPAA